MPLWASRVLTKALRRRRVKGVSTTVAEIQQAIADLPQADYARLSRWFHQHDSERWDSQIEQDSNDGKLDFLLAQAAQAKADGTLREL